MNDRDHFHDYIQQQINKTNVSKMAKIISRAANGTYTCEFADGVQVSGVKNQAYTRKWQPNMWVMLEFSSGDWIIVGISSHRGSA